MTNLAARIGLVVVFGALACAGGCAAAAAPSVAGPAGWATDPATSFEVVKWVVGGLVGLIATLLAWGWRVEARFLRLDAADAALRSMLDDIKHSLERLASNGERVASMEAKIDLLMTASAYREADRR